MLQIDRRIGGRERYILTSKPENLMLVPDEIRKCAVFIGEQVEGKMPRACGTAFFAGRQVEGTGVYYQVCITAKHVVSRIKDKSTAKILLRVNMKDGHAQWIETDKEMWADHPDQRVDLSFLMFQWDDNFDHRILPVSMFINEERIEKESIGIGDEVFLVGLFSQHYGSRRNIPLLRVGNIAAMPEEPVLSDGAPMDAYLVESRSIGGLSGSPVFVHLGITRSFDGVIRHATKPIFYLLGVMHGHWDAPDYDQDLADDSDAYTLSPKERVNMGIAIVIPSQIILEYFEQDAVKEVEESVRRKWLEEHSPVLDGLEDSLSDD